MGVHRERLAASRAHKSFVEGARAALQKLGGRVAGLSEISPTMVGARPLSFAAPSMMEKALGYKGALRFVAFGYSPRTRRFAHCDGGDDIPSESDAWLRFLLHPFIAPILPKSRYPTLYGVFSGMAQPTLRELIGRGHQQTERGEPGHCLLLDRDTRQLYICQRGQAILFFSLAEPDEKCATRVFIDGLQMSLGNEDYKISPPIALREELRASLDLQFKATSRQRNWPHTR